MNGSKIKNAPGKIWLCYGEIDKDCNHHDIDEVLWCIEPQDATDIPYIRVDVIEQHVNRIKLLEEKVAWYHKLYCSFEHD